jgi:hypothetical protein
MTFDKGAAGPARGQEQDRIEQLVEIHNDLQYALDVAENALTVFRELLTELDREGEEEE